MSRDQVVEDNAKKRVGRPKVPSYRNKQHRMGRIEDELLKVIPSMKSVHDRELILKVLEKLKE